MILSLSDVSDRVATFCDSLISPSDALRYLHNSIASSRVILPFLKLSKQLDGNVLCCLLLRYRYGGLRYYSTSLNLFLVGF